MVLKFLVVLLVGYGIYYLTTREKRQYKKEQIQFDAFIVQSAITIMSAIKNLKEEKFNLVFEKGSVYYETPEKTGECLLTPIRTLNDEEIKNFAELIYNSLLKENSISVKIEGTELTVSKMNKS